MSSEDNPYTWTFPCEHWASAGRRFSVRSYCGREERQVSLRFPFASAPVSLHKFPRASKIWVSRSGRFLHTCLFNPLSAVVTCTKNGQPCRRSSIELHKKGKELEPKHFKNHESEKNDNRRGQAGRDRPLPELPQDRQCPRYEKALLWRRVPISAVLWVAD